MISNEWQARSDYRYFYTIPTRWSDNDQFGHLNNVSYHRLFEAIIVQYLTDAGLNFMEDPVVPFAAETMCQFRRAVSFPDTLELGLRIIKLGSSSVVYGLAIFRQDEDEASAMGHWVHVYVDRTGEKPVAIPEKLRQVMVRDL